MAQSYTQIQRQIEALQKQADKLRASEVAGVVERIKVAIEHYGLTSDQLFGGSSVGDRKALSSSGKAIGKSSRAEGASSAAYADSAGNVWGGRGPRPRWLRDALAAGKSLEHFATSASSQKSAASTVKKIVGTGKRKAKASYRDDAGNSWSGFGPKPAWLKAALATGKSLEDLTAKASKDY